MALSSFRKGFKAFLKKSSYRPDKLVQPTRVAGLATKAGGANSSEPTGMEAQRRGIMADEIPTLTSLYSTGALGSSTARPAVALRDSPPTLLPVSSSLNGRIGMYHGDITKLAVDAIVNAANSALRGGGGVDGAIHRAAGKGLSSACRDLGGCRTGSAKATDAFNLPCRYVIHAVGPVYNHANHDKSEQLLRNAYEESLRIAASKKCHSVAFSAISTGVYGYPSHSAAEIAIRTVRDFLERGEEGADVLEMVVFVTFVAKDKVAYEELLPFLCPPALNCGDEDSGKVQE